MLEVLLTLFLPSQSSLMRFLVSLADACHFGSFGSQVQLLSSHAFFKPNLSSASEPLQL